ncbi:MAG: hypothetical protein IPK53_12105 [bacterium]|nr:hypothetical protein [bacterium]
MKTKQLKTEDLTDDQKLQVKQRAADIWIQILLNGDTCYSYCGTYHFWWNGPAYRQPQDYSQQDGLVNLNDLEVLGETLERRKDLTRAEREYKLVIAEEVRVLALPYCTPVATDPRLDEGLAHTRGARLKNITVGNYIYDWLHGTHLTMTI